MVTRKQFSVAVRELKANSDFFDPIMLNQFSDEGSLRPTTFAQVLTDYEFNREQIEVETKVEITTEDLYKVIRFLESYSDVDLYAPSRGEPLDNLIHDWWQMFQSDSSHEVIDEITDEINSGDAHLMTRNELVEFIRSHTTHELHDAERIAKEWFIFKGYEN